MKQPTLTECRRLAFALHEAGALQPVADGNELCGLSRYGHGWQIELSPLLPSRALALRVLHGALREMARDYGVKVRKVSR